MPPTPARETVVPYGKNKGKTLDQVATTARGLKWLDQQREREWTRETHPDFAAAVAAYLAEPAVARELERALGG